jgi:catechol 2,3-dioxygenase-like lactoylglutathione lyase family enzyme
VPDAPLAADLDHVAVAVERWTDAWPRYLGDLGGQWMAGGRGPGFAPAQMRFPHPERAMKVEVLEPNQPELNDFLRRFLDASGPGPHHLTFKVPDLEAAIDVMRDQGYEPIGIDLRDPGWKESFLHPKQACGIVVQVAQAAGEMPTEVPVPPFESRVARPASLVEVVLLVPDLAPATDLFEGLLGGRRANGDGSDVVLDWPAGGRIRLTRPADGSPEADWLGSRPGRLGHLVFELDDPGAVPDAEPAGDGTYELPAPANLGVRLVLRPRA